MVNVLFEITCREKNSNYIQEHGPLLLYITKVMKKKKNHLALWCTWLWVFIQVLLCSVWKSFKHCLLGFSRLVASEWIGKTDAHLSWRIKRVVCPIKLSFLKSLTFLSILLTKPSQVDFLPSWCCTREVHHHR